MRPSPRAWWALVLLACVLATLVWMRFEASATPGSATGADGSGPPAGQAAPRLPPPSSVAAAAEIAPPIPVDIRDLVAQAGAGDVRAACRLGALLAQCSAIPPEFYSEEFITRAREQERQAVANNDLVAADQAARFLLDAVNRRAACEGIPPDLAMQAPAYLRQAAMSGDPEARVRYLRGDAFLGIGFAASRSLKSPDFDQWRREVSGMLQAELQAGRPEAVLLLLEAYSETGMALSMITPPDPLLDRAYLRLAQRVFDDFELPEGWPTPAPNAALDAQADELAARWHATHYEGRRYSIRRDVVGFAMSLFPVQDQPWVEEDGWLSPCTESAEADR